MTYWCVSCPQVLVHLHFNLVNSVLAQFQIGQPSWCEMITELRPSFQNRTSRPNVKSARGDETAHILDNFKFEITSQRCRRPFWYIKLVCNFTKFVRYEKNFPERIYEFCENVTLKTMARIFPILSKYPTSIDMNLILVHEGFVVPK